MEEELQPEYGPRWWDQRVERMLGALVLAIVALLLALIVTVVINGWPSFAHNGLSWFTPGGNVEDQLSEISQSAESGAGYVYTFHAWPLIWSTILICRRLGRLRPDHRPLHLRLPGRVRADLDGNILRPVVRFLASVPSVIYGLLGVLVLVPFIGNHLITEPQKDSVAGIISLTGYS